MLALRRRRRHRLREAEVEQLHAGLRQHHVGGLQVPVHDPLPMGLVQRVRDLDPVPQRLLQRQRTLASRSPSVSPSRSSITRYSVSPSRPTSYSAQMCGCESCEIVFASRSKRCLTSVDEERRCGSTLTATCGRAACPSPCRPRPSPRHPAARGSRRGRGARPQKASSLRRLRRPIEDDCGRRRGLQRPACSPGSAGRRG